VFLNRAEIVCEKAFWFSHAAAALVTVVAFATMASWMEPEPRLIHKRPDNWPALLSGIVFYMLFQQGCLSIIRWLAKQVMKRVEKKFSGRQGQD
jgi:hypothetical protein